VSSYMQIHFAALSVSLLLLFGLDTLGVVYIGDPNAGNGWSTTGAVSVRAGHERTSPPWQDSRMVVETINGSGLDATGQIHSYDQTQMWLSQAFMVQGDPPVQRGGTVEGGHWVEFAFNSIYRIDEMLIWNYAENSGSLNPDGSREHNFYSAQGLRQVTIQYTAVGGGGPSGLWGSDNSNDWQTVFVGELDDYDPGEFNFINNLIPFDGAQAQYVVITTSADPVDMNWVAEKLPERFPITSSGLSEVRFKIANTFRNSANGHYYSAICVPGGITWSNAKMQAEALTHEGMAGHLATITSQSENDFIVTTFPEVIADPHWWIGGFQPPGSPEPDGNWQWVTGEPFVYTNWRLNPPEPSDSLNREHILQFAEGGTWNDKWGEVPVPGYVAEFDEPVLSIFTAIELEFPTVLDKTFQVQSSPSLIFPVWTNVGDLISGTSSNVNMLLSTKDTGRSYYRIETSWVP